MNLSEMSMRMKVQLTKVEEHFEKNKEKQVQDYEQNMNYFIQSLVNKEKSIQGKNMKFPFLSIF